MNMEQDVRQSVDELLFFQSGLLREKDVLTKMLTKIDEQIHALQVEQLHLINSMNKSMNVKENTTSAENATGNNTSNTLQERNLDLSVHNLGGYSEEEDDDDDEDYDNTDINTKSKISNNTNLEKDDLNFFNF